MGVASGSRSGGGGGGGGITGGMAEQGRGHKEDLFPVVQLDILNPQLLLTGLESLLAV